MKINTVLEDVGLTKSEANVYLALLKLGESTTGPVIKESGISSGKAYIIMDKLIEKGLVTYVKKDGAKHYQAKSPDLLLDYINQQREELNEKEQRLREELPKLKQRYEANLIKNRAELYEGINGLKSFYNTLLREAKEDTTIKVLGAPKAAEERFGHYFHSWNTKRIEKGVQLQLLYNHDCRYFGEERKELDLTEVKYMQKQFETPTWITLYENIVTTINPHETPICFLLQNKGAAKSYNNYFNVMWERAKD